MAEGRYNVVFVDPAGMLIFEAAMFAVPRAGDHIDLPLARVAGVIERVTWSVTNRAMDSRAIITVQPYPAA